MLPRPPPTKELRESKLFVTQNRTLYTVNCQKRKDNLWSTCYLNKCRLGKVVTVGPLNLKFQFPTFPFQSSRQEFSGLRILNIIPIQSSFWPCLYINRNERFHVPLFINFHWLMGLVRCIRCATEIPKYWINFKPKAWCGILTPLWSYTHRYIGLYRLCLDT